MGHPVYLRLRSSGVRRTPITNYPSLRGASGRFFGMNRHKHIHASVPKTGIGSEKLENQSQQKHFVHVKGGNE
jgi:hypothetical protein